MPKKFSNEDINNRLKDKDISLIDKYTHCKDRLLWKCLKCLHKWKTSADHIIGTSFNTGCPVCAPNRRVTNIIIDEALISQKRPIKRIGEVVNSSSKIEWQCLNCNYIWQNSTTNIIKKNSKCPPCHKSIGENTIKNILIDNKIEFYWQYPIYLNNKLDKKERAKIIDFYLPNYNLYIEYNGAQHYEDNHFKNKLNLILQKDRDEKIRKYCYDNSINLFEIDSRIYRKIIYKNDDTKVFKKILEIDILNYLKEINCNAK